MKNFHKPAVTTMAAKLPKVVWDDAGSDFVFIEVLLILEFNRECVPLLEVESLVSPSIL